jgi:hypothetical protein
MSQVPGVVVPDTILERLARFFTPDDQARAGIELAGEQVAWVQREGWDGVYLMSSASPLASLEVLQTIDSARRRAPRAP